MDIIRKIRNVFERCDDASLEMFSKLNPDLRNMTQNNLEKLLKNQHCFLRFDGIVDFKYISAQQERLRRLFLLFNFVSFSSLQADMIRSCESLILSILNARGEMQSLRLSSF